MRTDLKRVSRDSESGRHPINDGSGPALVEQGSSFRPRAIAARSSSGPSLAASHSAVARAAFGGKGKMLGLTLVVVLLVMAMADGAYRLYSGQRASNAPAQITQISHWHRPISKAMLSPDGRVVAFTSYVDGYEQVFVILTSGGDPLQLTTDEGNKDLDSFSADGTHIYFDRVLGAIETWTIPTLGGTPTHLVDGQDALPSQDGKLLYYNNGEQLMQASFDGTNIKPISGVMRPWAGTRRTPRRRMKRSTPLYAQAPDPVWVGQVADQHPQRRGVQAVGEAAGQSGEDQIELPVDLVAQHDLGGDLAAPVRDPGGLRGQGLIAPLRGTPAATDQQFGHRTTVAGVALQCSQELLAARLSPLSG